MSTIYCKEGGEAEKTYSGSAPRVRRGIPRWLACAAAGAFLVTTLPAQGKAESLAGSWSGGGWVSFNTGERERARCRAHYSPRASGYAVDATCATASGSASQSALLRRVGANSYAGSFYNSQYDVSGNIFVVVHGNTQSVRLTSRSGSASLTFSR